MNFISGLALILLTLVGYSSGRVFSRYKYKIAPGVLDIVIITIMWVGALWTRDDLGKWWAILTWLLVGVVTGYFISMIIRDGQPTERPAQTAKSPLHRAWESWKDFAQVMGDFQGRVMLIWFYFVFVTPFGLIARFIADPLQLKKETGNSFWLDYPVQKDQLDDARKQY